MTFGWYRKLKEHVRKKHANEDIKIPSEKTYLDQIPFHLQEKAIDMVE